MRKFKFIFKVIFTPFLLKQFLNPKTIPFIIINYNQLYYLKKLVDFAKSYGFKNIVIVDNNSTYAPLLVYYDHVPGVTIERMNTNAGHRVLFNEKELYSKYSRGFFILTDSDILPNPALPINFINKMLRILISNAYRISKVGFALKITNIPDFYQQKEKVLQHETRFWQKKIGQNLYLADIDTTFAVYKPFPFAYFQNYKAIRISGNYEAQHMGWYIDYQNLTEEQDFYRKTCNYSASWGLNTDGTDKGNY